MADKVLYEKVRALIVRQDFATAETLLRKHGASLDAQQTDDLRRQLTSGRRERDQSVRRKNRRRRHILPWRTVSKLQKGLFYGWLAVGLIIYPYSYFVSEGRLLGKPFFGVLGMDALQLAWTLAAVLFCGWGWKDARKAEKEGWLIALLVTLAALVSQAAHLIRLL